MENTLSNGNPEMASVHRQGTPYGEKCLFNPPHLQRGSTDAQSCLDVHVTPSFCWKC